MFHDILVGTDMTEPNILVLHSGAIFLNNALAASAILHTPGKPDHGNCALFSVKSLSSAAASIFLGQTYPEPEITSRPLGKAQNLSLSLRLLSALSLLYKLCCFDR